MAPDLVESGYRAKEKKSKIFPRGVRRLERSTGLSMLIAGYRQSEHGGLFPIIYTNIFPLREGPPCILDGGVNHKSKYVVCAPLSFFCDFEIFQVGES